MWRISISKKFKHITRLSAAPMGIIIFISPFIVQPRLPNIVIFEIIALILIFIGIVLIILALMEFRKFGITIKVIFRKEFRKKNVISEQEIHRKLVTTGLYAVIRHPQMIGFIIFYLGYSLLFLSLYCLYWFPLLIIIISIVASIEEKDLKKEFSQEYKNYKRKVGMLFPRVKRK